MANIPSTHTCFQGFDLQQFWNDSDYARKEYVESPPTEARIREVEAALGYRLPASYIALMRTQNGGIPVNDCCPTSAPTSWAENHVAITGFKAIGFDKTWSLCGDLGSQFMIDEWDYPDIGVYFGDCPSAGHDMIALDYRACGPEGEPCVVHVDQEDDYRITVLAPTFEHFVRMLVPSSTYEPDPEDERQESLHHVRTAPFNSRLQALCTPWHPLPIERAIRHLAEQIVHDKGYFALHADERSQLFYAIQFLLRSDARPLKSLEGFVESYAGVIAMVGNDHFGTGGWAPDFVHTWLQESVAANRIVQKDGAWCLEDDYRAAVLRQVEDHAR